MEEAGVKVAEQLRAITECPICTGTFTDPRMLPCIHTFCFECLNRAGDTAHKKPGDKMPCPLCRRDFTIPEDGMNGAQKNFFVEHLLEFKTALQVESATTICDMCYVRNDGKTGQIPKATMRCTECQDYYCEGCVKVHQFQMVTKHHKMVNIGNDKTSETKRIISTKLCTKHSHKSLDYYCSDCKTNVCVSCFVESHKLHDCKDVTTGDEEFRRRIKTKALKISAYADEMSRMRNNNEQREEDFLEHIIGKEEEIHTRNKELKDMVDRHTKYLLDELSAIKSKHLKIIETEREKIDNNCTIFRGFEAYCTEIALKGTTSDICSSVDELIARADELEKEHEAFVGRPPQSMRVYFHETDLGDVLPNANSNIVGEVEEVTSPYENFAVVIGLGDFTTIDMTKSVVAINLRQPNEVTALEQIPSFVGPQAAAVVCCNTIYVTGIGLNKNEIWKYNGVLGRYLGWIKCASLIHGRSGHSAAFVYETLYICGGEADSSKLVLDSVEAFDTITNKCTSVGKLVHGVYSSGNCVPFKSSLYIFGGKDKDSNAVSRIQVYNTKENTCSVISKPMPHLGYTMQAVLWETSVILINAFDCLIYNFETDTWIERHQFKIDVQFFGLVLANRRIFVIGGADVRKNEEGISMFVPRDDVLYVPFQNLLDDRPVKWKIHGKLPKPSLRPVCALIQSTKLTRRSAI